MREEASPYDYVEALLDDFARMPATVERPPTFLEVAGYPYYENVCSNILAFYLDPEGPHGLGSLLLDALASVLGVGPEGEGLGSNVSVEREVVTGKGNRIDILVQTDASAVAIENKIHAAVANPFGDYSQFVDTLASDGRHAHKLLLTLNPSGEGREWGFGNATHAEFVACVRSVLGEYVSRADTRYLTLLLDFLNTMENLQEGSRMDDRFRKLLAERGEEVTKFFAEVKAFRDELRRKVRDLGEHIDLDEYDNVKQWFYREKSSMYDVLVHDVHVSDRLPVYVDTTIYASGWEIAFGLRNTERTDELVTFLDRAGVTLEDRPECIHARFSYDKELADIAPVVQALVEKLNVAEDLPG